MGTLSRNAIVQLLNGETLAAGRKAIRPAHRAWVGVVVLEPPREVYLNTADAAMLGRMLVRSFEVPEDMLQKGYDIHDEELADSQRFSVTGLGELLAVLEQLGVDPNALDYKSATEYPL